MQQSELTSDIIQSDLVHQLGVPGELDWDYFLETIAKTPALSDMDKVHLLMNPAPGGLEALDSLRCKLKITVEGSDNLDWESLLTLAVKAKSMADIEGRNSSEYPRTAALIIKKVIPFHTSVFDSNIKMLDKGSKFFASVYGVTQGSPLYKFGVRVGELIFCQIIESGDNPLVRIFKSGDTIELKNDTSKCLEADWIVYKGNLDGSGFVDQIARRRAEDLCEHMNLRA